jgi:hypothetical protein
MDEFSAGARGLAEATACGADGEVLQGVIEEARVASRDNQTHFRLKNSPVNGTSATVSG